MGRGRPRPGVLSDSTAFYGDEPSPPRSLTFLNSPSPRNGAHLDTTTGTQPSGCRGVSIAPCCSVNAAILFAEPRMLVVVSRCARSGQRLSASMVVYLRFNCVLISFVQKPVSQGLRRRGIASSATHPRVS